VSVIGSLKVNCIYLRVYTYSRRGFMWGGLRELFHTCGNMERVRDSCVRMNNL